MSTKPFPPEMPKLPDFSFEKAQWRQGRKYIVGLDEVGRGAFAGPVVCAGVVFAPQNSKLKVQSAKLGIRVDDSKKLAARQREIAESWIRENAIAVSVAAVSAKAIDRVGIVRATHSGFRRVVKSIQDQLGKPLNFVLIDAFYVPYLRTFPQVSKRRRQLAIVHGDAKSFTIAAASIVAKVYRDDLMKKLGEKRKYKKYGWERNKGYGTRSHQEAIKKYGITGYHRKSFLSNFFSSQARLSV